MSNIANILYAFTSELSNASNGALANAILHLDVYEEYKGAAGKWVRFSGMRGGEPILTSNEIRRENAVHYVYFVAQPLTQSAMHRVAARELAENMANEWLIAVYKDMSLGNRVCTTGGIFQTDDWIKPRAVKMPVTVIQISVNPR
ncbi:MAG: hypothetical protein M3367_02980 [Acidobacteriota bacterium]|nr:hypothetical protein [Acidobacteriota bacterium]